MRTGTVAVEPEEEEGEDQERAEEEAEEVEAEEEVRPKCTFILLFLKS